VKNPNILFIQVDQLAATALSAYGNRFSKTPVLDRLAQDGVVFENAYCNFPLCAPSRFSMATGRLASDAGAYDNAAEFAADIPTYAHHLRKAGYQTSLSGKMHFIGPDQFHGFEKRLTADLYPADYAWVPNWGDEGERDTNDPRAVRIAGKAARTVQMDFDEEVAQKAVRHLFDLARSDDTRPFFLQVSFTHPHEPYLCKPEFWDLYEGVDIPLPEVPELSEAEHDPHSVRLLKDFGMLDADFTEEEIRTARHAYFGSVSYTDMLIGQVLDALEEAGFAENTAIVFTSDHGDFLGERGLWFKKHFFDHSLKVPLMLSAPWIKPGREATLASLVDLLPTFNGLAQGAPWQDASLPLEGADLTGLMTAPDAERAIYAEYLAEATEVPIYMIRRGRYKFVTSAADGHMLFDMEADPNERVNLAADPAQMDRVERFAAEAAAKWDDAALTARITASQQRRLLIRDAGAQGDPVCWNHGETGQEDVPWYRGRQGYNEWAFDHLPPAGKG
jgi:choline-sulfatase